MNNTDLISRASVLEALKEEHSKPYGMIGRAIEIVRFIQPAETSLEKELESLLDELPEDVEIRTCEVELGKKGYYAGNSSKYVFGNTRSEALLKFKEALNSNR